MKTAKRIFASVMVLMTLHICCSGVPSYAQDKLSVISTGEKTVEAVSSPEIEIPSSSMNWLWISVGVLALVVIGLAAGGGGGGSSSGGSTEVVWVL